MKERKNSQAGRHTHSSSMCNLLPPLCCKLCGIVPIVMRNKWGGGMSIARIVTL